MRVLILSSHPIADRSPHKAQVLVGLLDRQLEVAVLYSGTRVTDYMNEIRRRRPGDVATVLRARRASHAPKQEGKSANLREEARRHGVNIWSSPTLGHRRALAAAGDFGPDLTFNLSALYIPPKFLEAARHSVVGAHYAELPRVRGGDTIRWSILIDAPLRVSHQMLTTELDMGDVVGVREVEVSRGDTASTLRRKCQETSVGGYLAVADDMRAGTLVRVPQQRSEGSTFFRMGTFLRTHVDELLRVQRYSHYR